MNKLIELAIVITSAIAIVALLIDGYRQRKRNKEYIAYQRSIELALKYRRPYD